jgi:hypothetical protein
MASVIKRLEKRWAAEGDELAREAIECITALRKALADVTALAEQAKPRSAAVKRAHLLMGRFKA